MSRLQQIDATWAVKLRAEGWTWREIAEFFSDLHDRNPPFLGESVKAAVYRLKKEAK